MKTSIRVITWGIFLSATLWAHPHLQKQVIAKVGSGEVKISYFTSPANLEHAETATVGSFSAGAQLSVSSDLAAGGVTIPAGEYTIGAIKNSSSDWTMALFPGRLGRGESPDPAKLIKLPSSFSSNHGSAEHVHFDISPGSGQLAGKTTLIWHFGPLYLAGALD